MSDEYYIIVHNNILWMGNEWWVLCHCPQQHLKNGWWVMVIISLSTTTSYEWVMSGEYFSLSTTTSYEWVMSGDYYIIVHNNILWMGDEWWVLYHCPQQRLIEWVMSGEYYIIVHNNIYWMGDEWWVLYHCPHNILWMRDEWWLLYHCPQQHLMNGRWAMSIISLSTATSYEWVMSGDYYIIAHNKIYWMGDEWWVLYHCPKQHLMNGWWVVIIISLSTTTSYEWAMSNDYYIIVHSNILWMGDEWGVLYHCSQQHLMNGRWAMIIISLSTATSYEWVMSREYYIIVHNNIYWMGDEWWLLCHCPQQHLLNGWWVVSIISLSTTTSY